MIDLKKIQELDQPGSYPAMLDEMYKQFDPLSTPMPEIDDALQWLQTHEYSDTALIGLLIFTAAIKAELPSRPGLFESIKAYLAMSEPDNVVQELLRGLE
jgi:hypothetical protein